MDKYITCACLQVNQWDQVLYSRRDQNAHRYAMRQEDMFRQPGYRRVDKVKIINGDISATHGGNVGQLTGISVTIPKGVTALCSKPVSLFDSSSGASLTEKWRNELSRRC